MHTRVPWLEKNGLMTNLSKLNWVKHIVGIQCNAYRLNLTVLGSVESVKYLKEVVNMSVTV